jgi:hypothetical protein
MLNVVEGRGMALVDTDQSSNPVRRKGTLLFELYTQVPCYVKNVNAGIPHFTNTCFMICCFKEVC